MIPYANEPTTDNFAKWRIDAMCRFIMDLNTDAPILDIGPRSFATEKFESAFLTRRGGIDSTLDCDFNSEVKAPRGDYETIICTEVLEHVMNPLHFITNVAVLMQPKGMLILSTPCRKPHVESMHFAEYTKKSLDILFGYAGLSIVKYELAHPMKFWWHFTGFRPFYRMFFHHYHFYALTKNA